MHIPTGNLQNEGKLPCVQSQTLNPGKQIANFPLPVHLSESSLVGSSLFFLPLSLEPSLQILSSVLREYEQHLLT